MELDLLAAVPLRWCSTQGERSSQEKQFRAPEGPTGYPPFVRAAVRACAGLQPPPITAGESLDALKNVFAAYQSAESGRTQRVG
jgi:hypothetical protein